MPIAAMYAHLQTDNYLYRCFYKPSSCVFSSRSHPIVFVKAGMWSPLAHLIIPLSRGLLESDWRARSSIQSQALHYLPC